jgi:sulfonate transport system substrate-binding protein
MPSFAHPRRRLRRQPVTAAAVALAAVALTAACSGGASSSSGGSSGSSGPGGVLNVGELGSAKVTAALLADSGQDKGMKYKINWSLFPTGGGAFIEAVPSGSVDVALMADTPPIFGQVAGVATKVVGVETTLPKDESTVQIFAKPGSGITSTADLKGKKVGLTAGTILQYTVVQALQKAGLSYKDITPVNLPPSDALAAYRSGDVDAVAALGPQLAQLTIGGDTVVGDGVGTTTGYQYAVAASAALADKTKLADVTDYLQRVGRAQKWADEHRAQWTEDYAKVLGVPAQMAKVLVDRQQYGWIPIDDAVVSAQQSQADAYTQLGLIKKKLDVSAEFDRRLNDTLAGGSTSNG